MQDSTTWKKYIVIEHTVNTMRVRDKRFLFLCMRTHDHVNFDTFFPHYGITAGEFATWQVLGDSTRKRV